MSDAAPNVDDYIRQLVVCARALPQKEWQWGTFTLPDGQPIETVDHICEAQNHSARQSETAELWGVNYGPDTSVVCFTGNGPRSRGHAQFLAATQPRNLLWILNELGDRIERLTRERDEARAALANGPDLYEALKELVQAHDAITRHNGRHTLENFEEYRALVVRADAADVQARAALSKVEAARAAQIKATGAQS